VLGGHALRAETQCPLRHEVYGSPRAYASEVNPPRPCRRQIEKCPVFGPLRSRIDLE
jgi:hypothetical protein